MALIKSTAYAPDIYRALNGILLVYKPSGLTSMQHVEELRHRISESLNDYEQRPIAKRLVIEGGFNEEKRIAEVPNLADHPLVVGPRYLPWELSVSMVDSNLGYRTSGLNVILLGSANKFYRKKMKRTSFTNVYHIAGRFGYVTDNFFSDGRILDKATFKHVRSGKFDSVLSRIESTQNKRLFDAANVPLDSEEAYELAKAWPSRPPRMAQWPVIYRLRCIHLKPPDFKVEVTVVNENEQFLAQLPHDIGRMLKSGAFTESIRRVKFGPFNVDDSLLNSELGDLQAIIDRLNVFNQRYKEIHKILNDYNMAMPVRTEYHLPTDNKS